jgi:hypothetical protein
VAFRRTRLVDRARRMALEASRAPPALPPYVGEGAGPSRAGDAGSDEDAKEGGIMKRTWIVLMAGLVLLLLGSATDGAAQAKKLKVAIVLPGVITDKAWNELGHNGIKTIEKELGAEVAFVEKVAQPDQAEAGTAASSTRRPSRSGRSSPRPGSW